MRLKGSHTKREFKEILFMEDVYRPHHGDFMGILRGRIGLA